MKPTNPMAQLQQWKDNHAAKQSTTGSETKIGSVKSAKLSPNLRKHKKRAETAPILETLKENCETNCESKNAFAKSAKVIKNPQGITQEATKPQRQGKLSINPLAFKFSQLTRQFKLILDSNRKCLEVYPEEFHHKLKMRDEMRELIDRLKSGGKLFNALAKAQGVTFTRDNAGTLREFNRANGYLIFKFNEVIEQIDRLNIERVENQKLQGGRMMSKVSYQIKAYDRSGKPWILGSSEDLERVLEIVRGVLVNRKEYHTLTVQRIGQGGNNG